MIVVSSSIWAFHGLRERCRGTLTTLVRTEFQILRGERVSAGRVVHKIYVARPTATMLADVRTPLENASAAAQVADFAIRTRNRGSSWIAGYFGEHSRVRPENILIRLRSYAWYTAGMLLSFLDFV